MPRQLPPVADDVFEALQELAEPLVDDIDSVLRRLLGLTSTAAESSPEVRGEPAGDEGRSGTSPRTPPKSRPGRARKKKGPSRTRAPRGSLLPEREYEVPLLEALVERGGSAPASELIEDVGRALEGRLTEMDREVLASGLTRWKNRAQFARLKLVHAGQLKNDSPRGVWEITQAGRERVKSREDD